jgi:uncharacterized membrane protein
MTARAVRAALIAVGFSPFLTAWARELPVLGVLARASDAWFAFQCERDAARLLAWPPHLPVCSRCLGIYMGLGLGAALVRPRLSPRALAVWAAFGALAMALDVASETLGLRPPWAPLRLATGLALAYPVSVAVISVLGAGEAARTART